MGNLHKKNLEAIKKELKYVSFLIKITKIKKIKNIDNSFLGEMERDILICLRKVNILLDQKNDEELFIEKFIEFDKIWKILDKKIGKLEEILLG